MSEISAGAAKTQNVGPHIAQVKTNRIEVTRPSAVDVFMTTAIATVAPPTVPSK